VFLLDNPKQSCLFPITIEIGGERIESTAICFRVEKEVVGGKLYTIHPAYLELTNDLMDKLNLRDLDGNMPTVDPEDDDG
jgi:hypothetical protein